MTPRDLCQCCRGPGSPGAGVRAAPAAHVLHSLQRHGGGHRGARRNLLLRTRTQAAQTQQTRQEGFCERRAQLLHAAKCSVPLFQYKEAPERRLQGWHPGLG